MRVEQAFQACVKADRESRALAPEVCHFFFAGKYFFSIDATTT